MQKRKVIASLFAFSTIGWLVAYYILKIYECGHSSFCLSLYTEVGTPLFYGMATLALVFFILLFVPRAFNTWKKFAIWATPIALLLFATAPQGGPGGIGTIGAIGIGPSAEDVYLWVSVTYVLLSVIVIALAAFRKSKEKEDN